MGPGFTPAGDDLIVGFLMGETLARREDRLAAVADRLRERGVSEAVLARISAPIGLAIGARTPDQIALAVMAQVVAARNGAPVG